MTDETPLKPGWLKRQADQVEKDLAEWPEWMRVTKAQVGKALNESTQEDGYD